MNATSCLPKLPDYCCLPVRRCISDWKPVVYMIAKIALHILFPVVVVLVAHCLVPLAWAPVAVPTIAMASIAAAFFGFTKVAVAEILPPGAPRGIYNTAGNCWVNSLFQMIHADSNVKAWLLSDACPVELLPFKNYIQAYDAALAQGLSVVDLDSQVLRTCLASLMKPGIRFGHEKQEDPTEGWMVIHDRLPEHLKSQVRQIRHYTVPADQPAILDTEATRTALLPTVAHLSLAIRGRNPTLATMMHAHCNARETYENLNLVTFEGSMHRYPQVGVTETVRFRTAPPSLWIDFKRTNNKIHKEVAIPDFYYLQLEDGSSATYQLTSFAIHLGETGESGHYISYRKGPGDGLWYRISDDRVTRASDEELYGADRSQAYFVQYSRVGSS